MQMKNQEVRKPLIVITPQKMAMEAPFEEGYHYSNGYNFRAIREAGGIPLLPDYMGEEEALELMAQADGLLLSGGADVSPSLYGEEPLEACGTTEPDRDRSDCALLRSALMLQKPVLCICRGSQLANAYCGGTLYQDLKTQFGKKLCHKVNSGDQYAHPAHAVKLLDNTPLQKLFGTRELMVNSLHHQGIRKLAPGLLPMAEAPDGLVESWYLPGREQWLRGVQWHPEMLADNTQSQKIFGAFVSACLEFREKSE